MAVFTQGGRIVLAQSLYDMTFFLAVGQGDATWDSVPPPATPAEQAAQDAALSGLTDLADIVGVTSVRDKYFVAPDPTGSIAMADGARYKKSDTPTAHLFVSFQLDLADAQGTTLRETGIFVGTKLATSVPAGQTYIPKANVTSFGTMIETDRFPPIIRDGSIGQSFNYIVTT
ncbi:hypothetical protein GRI33_06985 [Brucella sp. BO3]|uniref:hypothetical protein n=1 Tax=unclassified Brucella TaxID=2632610 RepID=UPI00084FB6D2|nr:MULTISPECIES: hypothetical protein [unclassified Brucella]OEI84477.1 hypothetical protein BA060_03240 [Brucella sp. B13-0095]QGA56355.1 hypothetical protein GHC20_04320 [Brucella sp. 2280]QMV26685.1 hypothetical protein GRI33_06985 [Brucella sp. BO3]UWF58460.1 hypothetical protein NYO66_07735 [Brucella sp. 2716]